METIFSRVLPLYKHSLANLFEIPWAAVLFVVLAVDTFEAVFAEAVCAGLARLDALVSLEPEITQGTSRV